MTDELHSQGESLTQLGGARGQDPAAEGYVTGGEGLTAAVGVTGGEALTGGAIRRGSEAPFAPGQVVAGRFQILRVIGRGGMAIVYEAEDRLINARVALKAILPAMLHDPAARRRISKEVNTARRIRHKGLVKVFDLLIADGTPMFTMEYLAGQTLRDYLTQQDRIEVARAFAIVDAVAEALEQCHKTAVHRDVSPENIMLLPDGTVKLLDFGIAKPVDAQYTTQATQRSGKAYYTAPEQRKTGAQADVKADIWALGVCLFEMLAGELPMGFQRIRRYRPDLPAMADDVIGRAVCAHEQRFASMSEFRKALEQLRAACDKDVAREATARHRRDTLRRAPALLKNRLVIAGLVAVIAWAMAGRELVKMTIPHRHTRTNAPVARAPEPGPETDIAAPEPGVDPAVAALDPSAPESPPSRDPWDFSGYWSGSGILQMRLEMKEEQGKHIVTGWVVEGDYPTRHDLNPGEANVAADGTTVWQGFERYLASFDKLKRSCELSLGDEKIFLHLECPLGKEKILDVDALQCEAYANAQLGLIDGGVELNSSAPGGGIVFHLPSASGADRMIGVRAWGCLDRFDRGEVICQAYLDGSPLGEGTTFSEKSKQVVTWLGQDWLTSGPHTVTLIMTNPEEDFVEKRYSRSEARVARLCVFSIVIVDVDRERRE